MCVEKVSVLYIFVLYQTTLCYGEKKNFVKKIEKVSVIVFTQLKSLLLYQVEPTFRTGSTPCAVGSSTGLAHAHTQELLQTPADVMELTSSWNAAGHRLKGTQTYCSGICCEPVMA